MGGPSFPRLLVLSWRRIDNGQPFNLRHVAHVLVGADKVIESALAMQIQSDGELNRIESAKAFSHGMFFNQPRRFLKMAELHSGDPDNFSGDVGPKEGNEQVKIGVRNLARPNFSGEG